MFIHTGKELLDAKIASFNVHNGAWIGEVAIRNQQPHLYCKDCRGNLVNSFPIHNNSVLDLDIEPLTYRTTAGFIVKKNEICGRCGVQINDVDPKFNLHKALPITSVSLLTPIPTTAYNCELCHKCARDLWHFLSNGKEVESEVNNVTN